MEINALHTIDWYKASHKQQYPEGTELVYSNFTPRSNKLSNLPKDYRDGIVWFGLQYFIFDYLTDCWEETFFSRSKEYVLKQYIRRHKNALGDIPDVSHIEALHDLGYLPIEIKALPEGTYVPIGVPVLTIKNTHPDFFWLTNYLESVLSNMLWKPCVSATTARYYLKVCNDFADKTCDDKLHLPFQCHDFSFRGMGGPVDGAISGMGHLTSFVGTDTVLSIDAAEDFYNANCEDVDRPLGMSVPATEHSVMSMGTKENEIETFRRLITKIYPEGIVSIVSDTWDFWKVIGEYLPTLKNEILSRKGDMSKVVIRPDSGDPVKIICGDDTYYDKDKWPEGTDQTLEYKGAIESLWDIFGGTINSKGYKVLNPKIGLIYGDSITPERVKEILTRLEQKGFASSNVVFGVGSFTYTYVTRDTYGFAVKATAGIVDGEVRQIFKDPVTDSGTKKSLKGFLGVYKDDNNNLKVLDNLDKEPYDDLLELVYQDGELINGINFENVRENVRKSL